MVVSVRRYTVLVALLSGSASAPAVASNHILYECIDASGSKQFTNIPANPKACKVLNIAPQSPAAPAPPQQQPGSAKAPARAPQTVTPSNFPRVDRALQRERDSDRRRILETELGNEEKLLEQARKELAEQESVRLGTEKNYQRVLDRLEPFQQRVKRHQDNISNLQREISKIR